MKRTYHSPQTQASFHRKTCCHNRRYIIMKIVMMWIDVVKQVCTKIELTI